MTTNIKIRVKKLIALASNNPNVHEAASAASMASKLMEKHKITLKELYATEATPNTSSAKQPPPFQEETRTAAEKTMDDIFREFDEQELKERNERFDVYNKTPAWKITPAILFSSLFGVLDEANPIFRKYNRVFIRKLVAFSQLAHILNRVAREKKVSIYSVTYQSVTTVLKWMGKGIIAILVFGYAEMLKEQSKVHK
jgi:hypothetical protein